MTGQAQPKVAWLTQGAPMAWWNRRTAAERENWPHGALQACQDIQHRHPGWHPTYRRPDPTREKGGYYAHRQRGLWGGAREAWGETPEDLEKAIEAGVPTGPLAPS